MVVLNVFELKVIVERESKGSGRKGKGEEGGEV